MTDGISRAAGVGPMLELCGKKLRVVGRTNDYYARVEAEIIAQRGNPFEIIIATAQTARLENDDVDFKTLGAVSQMAAAHFRGWRNVTYLDHLEFTQTARGQSFAIWLCVGAEESGLTADDVFVETQERLHRSVGSEWQEWISDIQSKINQASGQDELGNSTGSEPQTSQAESAQTGE